MERLAYLNYTNFAQRQEIKPCELTRDAKFALRYYPYVCEDIKHYHVWGLQALLSTHIDNIKLYLYGPELRGSGAFFARKWVVPRDLRRTSNTFVA